MLIGTVTDIQTNPIDSGRKIRFGGGQLNYGQVFDDVGDVVKGSDIAQRNTNQRPITMAEGGISLATPAAGIYGKVFDNVAARNIYDKFRGTPGQAKVREMLLNPLAYANVPTRPEGQVKLSTLYNPEGEWRGAGPEPTGVSAPEGQEAYFTPGKKVEAPHSPMQISGMQWSDLVRHGYDPWTRTYPGAGTYKPGKVDYKFIEGPSTTDIYQEDPSKYRIASMNKGGILSTKKVQQMVA